MNERIVKAIKNWILEGCSNSYIQDCALSIIDSDTSLADIAVATDSLRKYMDE